MKLIFALKSAIAATPLIFLATGSLAAGTDQGVEAGFFKLGQDLNAVLSGAGGYVILIISIIIGGVLLAVTGRWSHVMVAFGVAVVLGYGIQTLTGFGGVTATIDMIGSLSSQAATMPGPN